jgi:hypothetical protein
MRRQSLAQLFRDLHKIEAQIALLRLDLQAAGVFEKRKITVDLNQPVPGAAGCPGANVKIYEL